MTQHAAWFVPLPQVFCLIATGNDRRKFLHNFCTNDIRELPDDKSAEAFFVDVRARVLGHGWILAKSHQHEIWGLRGDSDGLLKHLNKYVITEDVQFRDASQQRKFFAVTITSAGTFNFPPDITVLPVEWAGQSFIVCSVPVELEQQFRATMTALAVPEGSGSQFELLRIAERWPVVGTDISVDHLAPEAERNTTAISYRKGCYLGQEPIARLDAMGHVNKALRCMVIEAPAEGLQSAEISKTGVGTIGTVSSVAPLSDSRSLALAMIRTHGLDLTTGVTVTLPAGQSAGAVVQRPGEPLAV